MRRLLLVLCAISLAVASHVSAQTHPCDQAPVVNPTFNTSNVWFGLCFPAVNADGGSTIFVRFKILVDSVVVFDGALPQTGGTTPGGYNYYVTPPITMKRGGHTAVTYGYGEPDGPVIASSDPYSFRIKIGGSKRAAALVTP